jgi:hypothetical protein
MRLSLSTHDEAFVRLRELGAQLQACAPTDFAEPLAEVATELMLACSPVSRSTQPSAAELTVHATDWLATRFDTASGAER